MTLKNQIAEATEKLAALKIVVREFGRKVTNPRSTQAYHYSITSEAPPLGATAMSVTAGGANLSKVNVIPALELAAHVQTAEKLGYDTHLTVSGNRLLVSFVEKRPSVPNEIYFA